MDEEGSAVQYGRRKCYGTTFRLAAETGQTLSRLPDRDVETLLASPVRGLPKRLQSWYSFDPLVSYPSRGYTCVLCSTCVHGCGGVRAHWLATPNEGSQHSVYWRYDSGAKNCSVAEKERIGITHYDHYDTSRPEESKYNI